uniref:Uncharacterized protein n=1 Tax=Anguilla anguilla TaxID=7936 RepID=A0A0E9RE23_ANGAN
MTAKISPRAQRQLIQEITKDPRRTSIELQSSPASAKVNVHDSTIRNLCLKDQVEKMRKTVECHQHSHDMTRHEQR